MNISIQKLIKQSGVDFGTSGVRGLVSDMTDKVCVAYVIAFMQYLEQQDQLAQGDKIGIAGDLRNSSPRIIKAAIAACRMRGYQPIYCGLIPSPAIALYGISQQMPTIMITGSHIPDDRNGIKFNTAKGEILKHDETQIRQQIVELDDSLFDQTGYLMNAPDRSSITEEALEYYINRYISFSPGQCLKDKHIGLYEHSSVAREVFRIVLEKLGARVTSLGRSDTFIAVDTEAIRPEDTDAALHWAEQHDFDCIVSTDGDGDRPLISDEKGQWLRGDIAGILCAAYLKADTVVTPVSCNSAVEKCQLFSSVIRTKIGSPYVIAGMQEAQKENPRASIVGYEANGGFLQLTVINRNGKVLAPLPTRDAIIVALSVILSASEQQLSMSQLVEKLPSRYTYSDRLKNFPTELSQARLTQFDTGDWQADSNNIQKAFPSVSQPVSIDKTDGVRITLENDDVIHLRPSGNAPELRCYTESNSAAAAKTINESCIQQMAAWKN
ncbi:MAG: phosphomannomutase [Methylophaga sp.]